MGILEFGVSSLGLSFVCAANTSTHSEQLSIALSLLEAFWVSLCYVFLWF